MAARGLGAGRRSAKQLGMAALICLAQGVLVAQTLSAQTTTVLRGRTLDDASERPLPGAIIAVQSTDLATRSDSLGYFRIPGVPTGPHTIQVRLLGFAPFSTRVRFAAPDSVQLDVYLVTAVRTLPEVAVTGTVTDRKLAEFAERRHVGIGRFMDSADVAKAHGTRFSDKISVLPGLKVMRTTFSNTVVIVSTRGTQSFKLQGSQCAVAIYLDGAYLGTSADYNVNELQSTDVAGVEWYAGPATIPPRFNSTRNACGVLVIWTR